MKSIALIGHGAIARDVMHRIDGDPLLRVAQVLVRPNRRAEIQAALGDRTEAICSVAEISADVDFVLECAGHGAVQEHGLEVLGRGLDLGVLSVGALANDALRDDLQRASREGRARIVVVPGAIGGIDAIAAAGPEGLDRVTYDGTKAPLSWTGTPAERTHDLSALTEATEVFSGTAREAAQRFPKNANVVATVALAGLGFDRTRVRLVADPKAVRNTHHILAEGPNFHFDFTSSGATLPDNPKTSALTSLAACRVLKSRAHGLCL
ncbi:aspartate dehydrogenase [Tropicimonas sediminicola]|uniref:L-aspartate dehydrogenase n=1 Tax=Tropicimonas sediminicola TaxID=1031541 RepID=A0A239LAE1_9RHOB|nr:aspartate dehydrogenase [Tropicimonas sediminicola]SNT26514.1 aspartate dehydrogenase [Tropicimonas sediminicola]